MTMLDRAADVGVLLTTSAIAAITGGILWLVRRVITNQAQISAVVTALGARDKTRDEDRIEAKEASADLKKDIRELRAELRNIHGGGK